MINVFGSEGTPEYEAALALRDLIRKDIPEAAANPDDLICIIANAKCHGQKTRDLDVVLLAHFSSPITYSPSLPFATRKDPSQLQQPDLVAVESLCIVIEVKDHSAGGVKFEGTTVKVRYQGTWHDASTQSFEQGPALRNYLTIHKIGSPYVCNLVWLRNLSNADLPRRPHNIVAGNLTWELLLNVVGQVSPPALRGATWTLSHGMGEKGIESIRSLLTQELHPTQLDRRRMEQINQRIVSEQNLLQAIGKQLLILRGRGGTGKTIRLLQFAKQLYEQAGARILILTYNKALVADLRRLLTMMGVVDEAAERSIRVQTVYSFFYSILRNLDVISDGEDEYLKRYEALKDEAVELFEASAINSQDIERLKSSSKPDFLWDYLFIDEAQDWPDNERQILFSVYSATQFVIADGVDQLIRSDNPANWRGEKGSHLSRVVPLEKCIRMKANITRFVSGLAGTLGLPQLEWLANEQVLGGRIIILDGDKWVDDHSFIAKLIGENGEAGNKPIDMLFCVPPILSASVSSATLVNRFLERGYKVWDGTDQSIRNTYPTDTDQVRIVQYDSCRGLEGWMSVNFGLDEFYEYKLQQLTKDFSVRDHLEVDTDRIRLQVARWLLIPLTRAMDTLVIGISSKPSFVRDALERTAQMFPDTVEWIKAE